MPHYIRSMTDIYAESELFTPGKTPTQVFETMLMVNMTVSETPEDLDLMAIPAVDALSGIRDIIGGPYCEEVLATFDQLAANQDEIVEMVQTKIATISQAESVKFYMLDDAQ
jgi:hypothetical protein